MRTANWRAERSCSRRSNSQFSIRNPQSAAFTLVEVLVSTVLLGAGLTGLIAAASLAVRNQQRVDQRAAALWLAQEMLAEVDLLGPQVYLASREMSGTRRLEAGGASDATYEWALQIERFAVGELFRVEVKVSWLSAAGTHVVELETWLNDYEAVAMETADSGAQITNR